jgi:hypothetical protein
MTTTTPAGFVIWRSAATGLRWYRAVRIGEAKTFPEAVAKAAHLADKHSTDTRVYPAGVEVGAGRGAAMGDAWCEVWPKGTITLRHRPSAASLVAKALAS